MSRPASLIPRYIWHLTGSRESPIRSRGTSFDPHSQITNSSLRPDSSTIRRQLPRSPAGWFHIVEGDNRGSEHQYLLKRKGASLTHAHSAPCLDAAWSVSS